MIARNDHDDNGCRLPFVFYGTHPYARFFGARLEIQSEWLAMSFSIS